jgi:hypothetical protein
MAGLGLTLACGGKDHASPPAIASFVAAKTPITTGASTTLTGTFSNGLGSINNGVGAVTSGTAVTVSPAASTTFTLTVTNPDGVAVTATAPIEVVAAPVISNFIALSPTIVTGEGSDLQWTITGATTVTLSGIGVVTGMTTTTVHPSATTTYTLTATNAAGTSVTADATVTVNTATSGTVTLNTTAARMDPGPAVSRVFAAVVTGFDDPSLIWTTSSADTGLITVLNADTISYTPPATGGVVTLTATSVANPAVSASVAITVTASATPTQDLFNNWTLGGVSDNPLSPTSFTIDTTRHLVYFDTYHWNYAGGRPGLLSLKHSDGTVYGPWQAVGIIAYGGYFPRIWVCYPDIDLKAGTYTVIDSDPASWSYDASVSGSGFSHLIGVVP